MRIVADSQLVGVETEFASTGELVLCKAQDISPELVSRADALLVRSVTQVNEALLQGSSVRFVGTATSGMDHLDLAYLDSQKIKVVHAAGSNANAVVDYCLTAIASAITAGLLAANDVRVGIVGAGHVGSALASRLQRMNIPVVVYDPPRASNEPLFVSASLTEVLQCNVISLHVPLTRNGEYATRKLFDAAVLQQLQADTVLLNSCRGGVVDESALLALLSEGRRIHYVADVWEQEPAVSVALARRCFIATPHIAGYSQRAKRQATRALRVQFAQWVADAPVTRTAGQDEKPGPSDYLVTADDTVWSLMTAHLPLENTSKQFVAALESGKGRAAFESIRQNMLQRREFCEVSLAKDGLPEAVQQQAAMQGFHCL